MRYLIDGYNVLFLDLSQETLRTQRDAFICFLSQQVDQYSLEISCAFDAAARHEDLTRSHYHNLEVIYTDRKQTADDWIIGEIDRSKSPKNITVVTNDNHLAWRARQRQAQTKKVRPFLAWLKKKSKPDESSSLSPTERKTSQASVEYYLYHFEKRLREREKNS